MFLAPELDLCQDLINAENYCARRRSPSLMARVQQIRLRFNYIDGGFAFR